MNTYIVMLLEPAEKDLDEIYTYLYKTPMQRSRMKSYKS